MIHPLILNRFLVERAELVSRLGAMTNEEIDRLLADEGGTDALDGTREASDPREDEG